MIPRKLKKGDFLGPKVKIDVDCAQFGDKFKGFRSAARIVPSHEIFLSDEEINSS